MSILKKLLGVAPQAEANGAYRPSPLSLKLATVSKTDYDGGAYDTPHRGGRKVLVICTQERDMLMKNGKRFSTGNHPVEMGLPMLHLKNAGFGIDIATPTGESAKLEMWAMPQKDQAVLDLFQEYEQQLQNPLSLGDLARRPEAFAADSSGTYAAIFIPGGHGAMLGLPENEDLGRILRVAHDAGLFTLTICHGPAALLAAAPAGRDQDDFLYRGYEIAAFPDSVDKQTPMIGYMPGHLTWEFGKQLSERGVKIINKAADATCHVDRRLITGASPKAANAFGRLAATELLRGLQ